MKKSKVAEEPAVNLSEFLAELYKTAKIVGADYVFKDNGRHVGYLRTSTEEQNDERQQEGLLANFKIDKWYAEKLSAKDANRPQLLALLEYIRDGDTVYVHDFSRLARNTKDLLLIVEYIEKVGARLVSNKERIDTQTTVGKLFLTVLAAIYEFERQNMLDRQREGIDIAKRKGVYKGRQHFWQRKSFDKAQFEELYQAYLNRKISKSGFAKQIGASRPTLEKLLIKRENEGAEFPKADDDKRKVDKDKSAND